MKKNKEIFENLLNHVLIKEYPFIEVVEVYRLREFFAELQVDINLMVNLDFIEEHVQKDCYDKMDDIFFSLFSFNVCSDTEINEKKLKSDLLALYKMVIVPNQTLYHIRTNVSIIGVE